MQEDQECYKCDEECDIAAAESGADREYDFNSEDYNERYKENNPCKHKGDNHDTH